MLARLGKAGISESALDPMSWHRRSNPGPICAVIALSLGSIAFPPAVAMQQREPSATRSDPAPVDFRSQIWPIFRDHCVRCHGPEKQKGELRLDRREFLEAGGHTGSELLSAPPESSQLFLRVSSTDPKYRMPAEGPPLSTNQIELIRDWIAAGADWQNVDEALDRPAKYRLMVWLEPFFSKIEEVYAYVKPIVVPLFVLLVIVWLVEHAKYRQRGTRSESVAAEGLALVRREWYLIGVLVLGLVGFWSCHRQSLVVRAESERQLKAQIAELDSKNHAEIRHGPNGGPIPPRPKYLKRLGGTYYRGNDERDPRLFNGGFYRTATMRVYLSDAEHTPLQLRDAAGDGPLYISLEIERANEATPALFSDALMRTVFLSQQVALLNRPENADTPVYFENVEPGRRWLAHYPIRTSSGNDSLSGMIYLYMGRMVNGAVDGKFHYGISYDVRIENDRISPESEIWMGSLSVPVNLFIPPPDRMVMEEWFDFRPLPEIEGENSKDPALLGIPEYVK